MNEKRLEQLKETWIKNVLNYYDYSREQVELMYCKIQPYK